MRGFFRAMILATLGLSFLSAPLSMGMDLTPRPSPRCCDHQRSQTSPCEKNAPKAPQDKACCAVCFLCLTIALADPLRFAPPAAVDRSYPDFSETEQFRGQSPPVPPPRS